MTDTVQKRRPGRPRIYGEEMVAVELYIPRSMDAAARAEAEASGVSVAEVCRRWLERGRGAVKRARKPIREQS